MNWWIILALIIVIWLVMTFLHFEHKIHIMRTVLLVLLLLLLVGSAYFWFSSNSSFDSPKAVATSFYSYFVWLGDSTVSLFSAGKDGVSLIGNAIKVNKTNEETFDGRR